MKNTLNPYEDEWICIACGCKIIKKKNEVTETSRKEINFLNRLEHAE